MSRDTDGSPEGRDAQRLDGEAATAGAGTASHKHGAITPQQADIEAAQRLAVSLDLPWAADNSYFGSIVSQAFAHHAQQARLEERERWVALLAGSELDVPDA